MYLKKEIKLGKGVMSVETGKLAKQAAGSIVISQGDTVLLVTVTSGTEAKLGDFMPLTVDFVSKMYAVGKIPGGYLKRESRPPEHSTLISRLIDRPLRPLFPDNYTYETQVIITTLSIGDENVYESLAMTGASFALMISKIPFLGPIAGAKVGYINGEYVLNPTLEEFESSLIDLSVAVSHDAIVMVEGEAKEVSEEIIEGALNFVHEQLKPICDIQVEMKNELKVEDFMDFEVPVYNEEKIKEFEEMVKPELIKATLVKEKLQRYSEYEAIKHRAKKKVEELYPEDDFYSELSIAVGNIKKSLIRNRIINDNLRIDGRSLKDIRPITCDVDFLPRVHGNALFTRGETQALVATTLAPLSNSKREETIDGDFFYRFMLHYNFPPFSVGEARFLKSPGRREIGHGNLALRGVKFVLPSEEKFPYAIRLVSEVLESNGSSSMATVCGSSLALMDAGVPVLKPVAGIAMGLIKNNDDYYVLSDILGDEDHLGDMDFKVVGTKDGITALQMDIKIKGLPEDVMKKALAQAKEGRMHILGEMAKTIESPREKLKEVAPRIEQIKIENKKIPVLIGSGGKTIKEIIEKTQTSIDIDDENCIVSVCAANSKAMNYALELIKSYITDVELGKVYKGKVTDIKEFGALVEVLPKKTGLLHISEIAYERVEKVEDYLKLGDEIEVKVIQLGERGKISLSLKALKPMPEDYKEKDKNKGKKNYNKKFNK